MTVFEGGASETLMKRECNENCAVCKDGAPVENYRLGELVDAFDRLGFRISKVETDGKDYQLSIRDMRDDDED